LEDITGEPFVGRSGAILTQTVREQIGLEREEYSVLNSIKCRPPQNREPSDREKSCCRPWLMEQLRIIKPTIIVTLGAHGAATLLGERKPMHELRDHYYKVRGHPIHVVPTYHPMATAYVKARRADFEFDLSLIRKVSNHTLEKLYTGVRRHGRCTIPLDEPQNLNSGGIVLP
jgi:DNA polymerase